ncbi:uncharacterized protein LOC125059071 [Pieris napi]|uniref:uncharacterized protein LOC125059071 n=1 Tax=Pieris napi TaxID=78633 RepID=UPI001FBAA7BE|nr:uncharacterized protein LOC125059071 [Pieris napi]
MCNENHRVYKCDQFKNLSIEAREAEVSKRKLCSNCLRPGHSISNCRLSSCRACNKKHNSLLCHNNNSVNKVLQNESNLNLQTNEVKQNTNHEKQNLNTVASTSTVLTTLTSYSSNSEVLLGTAVVEVVVERDNSTYLARVLLDCGSQSSFVTDNLKNKLKIKTNSTKSRCISGLNNSISTATEYCTLKLKSRINAYTTDVHCMIISNISENLPSVEIDPEDLNIPNNTALADPNFHKSNKVDILIGSDVMWNIVKGGCQISLGENKPKLIYSKFGWLVSGPMTLAMPSVKCNKKSVCHFSQEIKDSLSKFWDLENFIMPKRSLSTDEQICEDSFNENTIRLPSGRFQVKMPLRESPEALGDSYSLAKRCFLNLERRFQKQPKLKEMYSDFIHENTNPSNLKQFVYNRVNEIHELTDKSTWHHISTEINPADIASRGVSPSKLQDLELWWSGPPFLMKPKTEWPSAPIENVELPELKVYSCCVSAEHSFEFDRFSKFQRMIRVVGYILRFIHNCKTKKDSRLSGDLSNDEIDRSTQTLIKTCQQDSFPNEVQSLKNNKKIHHKSRILSLNPYLDEHDLIRVGGRIQNSICEYSKKHPILLCARHNFTKLLFKKEHVRHKHCGPELLLSIIRDQYWPIGGRNLARSTFRKCIVCVRMQSNSIQPMMGNLPPPRVTLTYPFLATGVDFGGPFSIVDRKGRGCKISKCWLSLFVCLSTKALTLEVVSSLSTEAFLMCLRRFISRRGKPHDIYCDNGTDFVGANNELGRMLQASQSSIPKIGTA